MRIMVMGSGAVGGYFGASLHRSGHDVTFVARGPHLKAITACGLRIESVAAGDFSIHPTALETPEASLAPDLVLFCVKGYDNQDAIALMSPAVGEETLVLTLQNGVGSGDDLSSAFGPDRVLLGVTYIDSVRSEPGVVIESTGRCDIIFGREDGLHTHVESAVRDALAVPGIEARLSESVVAEQWKKLLFITGWSGMTCITRGFMKEVLDNPATKDLTLRLMRETEAVARVRGVGLADDAVDEMVGYFYSIDGETKTSMYADMEAGRPMEVAVLNGAVSRLGKELGVETPVNDFVTACLSLVHDRAMADRA